MNYKYHLLKYKGPQSRLRCPSCGRKQCFAPYVDDNDQIIGEEYGRCNHESSCGYVKYPPSEPYEPYHPKQGRVFSRRHSALDAESHRARKSPQPASPLCTIPQDIVAKSISHNYHNDFVFFLCNNFPEDAVQKAIDEYRIGVTKAHDTIFYQLDHEGKCRTGKIMKYNRDTGHRIKDESAKLPITWVHSLLKQQGVLPQNWELTQCLFGEHLLKKYPDKIVGLVEAEKTAVICSILIPECVWVAVGGKTQLGDKVDILEGRQIIAFPDIDGHDKWKEKCAERPYLNIIVSDYLQREATDEDIANGAYIADLLLRWQTDKTHHPELPPHHPELDSESPTSLYSEILKYFSPQYHSEVQALIEDFDLELVGVHKSIQKQISN